MIRIGNMTLYSLYKIEFLPITFLYLGFLEAKLNLRFLSFLPEESNQQNKKRIISLNFAFNSIN